MLLIWGGAILPKEAIKNPVLIYPKLQLKKPFDPDEEEVAVMEFTRQQSVKVRVVIRERTR